MGRFLVLALLFTWPLQLLARAVPSLWLPCMAVAGLGPSLAAIVVTRGAIFRRMTGTPWIVLVSAFCLPLALVFVAQSITGELVFAVPFWGAVIWPAFGEELGWRGYLQPELERRWNPRVAPLGVGLAWAIWHIPTSLDAPERWPLFALSIIGWSFVIARLSRRGAGSVWVGILAHAGINFAAGLFPPTSAAADGLRLGLLWLAAVVALFSLPEERTA